LDGDFLFSSDDFLFLDGDGDGVLGLIFFPTIYIFEDLVIFEALGDDVLGEEALRDKLLDLGDEVLSEEVLGEEVLGDFILYLI
jgi:hypothetical protein